VRESEEERRYDYRESIAVFSQAVEHNVSEHKFLEKRRDYHNGYKIQNDPQNSIGEIAFIMRLRIRRDPEDKIHDITEESIYKNRELDDTEPRRQQSERVFRKNEFKRNFVFRVGGGPETRACACVGIRKSFYA